jgi:hypothetical protein
MATDRIRLVAPDIYVKIARDIIRARKLGEQYGVRDQVKIEQYRRAYGYGERRQFMTVRETD